MLRPVPTMRRRGEARSRPLQCGAGLVEGNQSDHQSTCRVAGPSSRSHGGRTKLRISSYWYAAFRKGKMKGYSLLFSVDSSGRLPRCSSKVQGSGRTDRRGRKSVRRTWHREWRKRIKRFGLRFTVRFRTRLPDAKACSGPIGDGTVIRGQSGCNASERIGELDNNKNNKNNK